MKSLERRFQKIQAKNIGQSSYLCFVEAIQGQNFNQESIHRWFTKLVDKTDYSRSDKKTILAHLEKLAIASEDTRK